MEGLALIAASQYSLTQKRVLVETLIPLETADDASLRSAIVLTGMQKAPEHLFDRRYPNAIALSQLNLHDVPAVSKYSIWAITKLRHGYSSLLLPEDRIESSPAEIRKWVFRLLISDPAWMARKLDLFESIPSDPSVEVREEAAIQLRDSFIHGLDRIASKWFFREEHEETRALLLDHMAAQSYRSAVYAPIVVEMYKRAPPHSNQRIRMEAAAAKTPLFSELRRVALVEEGGFLFSNDNDFRGGGTVTNINVHGGNIGAITGSGDITGETIAAISTVENADTKEILAQVFEIVSAIQEPGARAEAQTAVQEAAKKPNRGAWKKILNVLQGVKTGTLAVNSTAANVDQLIERIGPLLG
jgi:hypothetical protein